MQQATNAILRGGTIMTPSVSAKTIAEQLAEKINAKLNYTPVEKLEEERQAAEQVETVTRYEEELEINDFPQVSRTHTFFCCKSFPIQSFFRGTHSVVCVPCSLDCKVEGDVKRSPAENRRIFRSCHHHKRNLFPSRQRAQRGRTQDLPGY